MSGQERHKTGTTQCLVKSRQSDVTDGHMLVFGQQNKGASDEAPLFLLIQERS